MAPSRPSKRDLAVATAVLKQRLDAPPPPPLWGPSVDNFYWQHRFLDDPHRLKAILAPRRSAKSYGPGLAMLKGVSETPGWAGLYLTKTIGLAEEIMWEPILKAANSKFELGLDFLINKHVVQGKGRMRLYGVDSSPDEVRKVVGKPHDYVFIDECAMFQYDLEDLINKYIYPSLIDRKGSLVLGSSPSDFTRGYFYELTKDLPDEPGMTVRTNSTGEWHVYRWTPQDNPYVAQNWLEEHERLLKANPWVVETPAYKQMWQGRWCIDDSNLVYKFSRHRNVIPSLPTGTYEYVLGIDLGWSDPTAFVVVAWSEYDQTAYVVHAESAPNMDFTAVAARIKSLCQRWPITVKVIDGASRQGVEEMIQRHGLDLTIAEKQGKYEYQKLLSADLTMGKLLLIDGATRGLQKDLLELIWWPEKLALTPPKYTEHPKLPNHEPDAMLYAWRHTHTYMSTARKEPENPAALLKAAAIEAALARQVKRDSRVNGDPWADDGMDDADVWGGRLGALQGPDHGFD